jgi:hypothetical protein
MLLKKFHAMLYWVNVKFFHDMEQVYGMEFFFKSRFFSLDSCACVIEPRGQQSFM